MTIAADPPPPSEQAMWDALGRPPAAPIPERVKLRWIPGDHVLSLSGGEVCETETVDDPCHVPVVGGLFCEHIFGPLERLPDGRAGLFSALDQRYLRAPTADQRAAGFVSLRRAVGWYGRMGHINLARPVRHPWWDASDDEVPLIMRLLVLPPGLRPLFPINAETKDPFDIGPDPLWMNSDLNVLYRDVIACNQELQDAQEDAAPHARHHWHEKLQEAIDALVMNESLEVPRTNGDRVSRSLESLLGGGREGRWKLVRDIDAMVRDDANTFDAPMSEPHFTFLTALRCVGMEMVPRQATSSIL